MHDSVFLTPKYLDQLSAHRRVPNLQAYLVRAPASPESHYPAAHEKCQEWRLDSDAIFGVAASGLVITAAPRSVCAFTYKCPLQNPKISQTATDHLQCATLPIVQTQQTSTSTDKMDFAEQTAYKAPSTLTAHIPCRSFLSNQVLA